MKHTNPTSVLSGSGAYIDLGIPWVVCNITYTSTTLIETKIGIAPNKATDV